jgi:Protein of unknown function (DUF2442)
MKSAQRGKSTLGVEITNISATGFWILLDNRELFLPFARFPWFRRATIRELVSVRRPSSRHLYWPHLGVDLAVESIEHPDRYPLVSKVLNNSAVKRPAGARGIEHTKKRSPRTVRR